MRTITEVTVSSTTSTLNSQKESNLETKTTKKREKKITNMGTQQGGNIFLCNCVGAITLNKQFTGLVRVKSTLRLATFTTNELEHLY